MRFAVALLGLLGFLVSSPWSDLYAQEVYKEGRYTVRRVKGTCKLEILLHNSDREAAAVLALFPKDIYYGELFTEKSRIGKARQQVRIQFEEEALQSISFVKDASGVDAYWRWQYLENMQGLLSMISRKREMVVSFSNGKSLFKYTVPLKGSSKAVLALHNCR